MPPVFGPVSPSPARLKSCAGSRGTAVMPSVTANSDTSGPSRNSSMTTVPAARACASAAARSSVTTTPLPAASPSALTTNGGPNSASAEAASPSLVQVRARAVGMPAASMTCLANDFDPSSMAARRPGPKQAMPAARSSSASPATSGASGPTTTRPGAVERASAVTAAMSARSTGCVVATRAMPGLPGAACRSVTSASAASARASACSRPPDPRRRTRTARAYLGEGSDERAQPQGLVAAWAGADGGHRRADDLLDRAHVGLGVPGQPGELRHPGQVLPPAIQVLVDRNRVMELGLGHRDLVVPGPRDVVRHADRHLLQAGQHVELGHEVVGDAVDPGRVAGDDRVEPPGAARPPGGHPVLAAGLPQPLALLVE